MTSSSAARAARLAAFDAKAMLFSPGEPGKLQNSTFSRLNRDRKSGPCRMIQATRGSVKSRRLMKVAVRQAQAAGRPSPPSTMTYQKRQSGFMPVSTAAMKRGSMKTEAPACSQTRRQASRSTSSIELNTRQV